MDQQRFDDRPDPYAEAIKVRREVDGPIRDLIEREFGLRVASPTAVHGGEESAAWRVTADGSDWLVRISPLWRTVAELEWVYAVVAHVARLVPEVPLPRQTRRGRWTTAINGHLVTVHPFVTGRLLDRHDPSQRAAVAELLACVHRALGSWPGSRDRPGGHPLRVTPVVTDPPELIDLDLDRWLGDLPGTGLARGLIHGDVYPRNLLWCDGRIQALVDWDELAVDWREQEVAWTAWELCHDAPGINFDRPAAAAFFAAYLEAGGVVSPGFGQRSTQFIRRRLRAECRSALAAQAAGRPFDTEYYASEVAAFANLRDEIVD